MRAREASHQLAERVGHGRDERVRKPAGRHCAERVAVETRLVRRHEARLTSHAQGDDAAFAL